MFCNIPVKEKGRYHITDVVYYKREELTLQVYIDYFSKHWQDYLLLFWQHIYISLIAVALAAAIGIPCGILCLKVPKIKQFVNTFFSTLRIIPSLAILVILIPIMGIGVKPALTALVVLAIPPVLIQTTLGFSQVPAFMMEVASAMGMDERRTFYQVQFPLALPYIMGGIKMAASEVIASAALAAYIGSGGLGVIIYNGISLMKTEYLVIGGVSVAALTLACNLLLGKIEKKILKYT